MIHILNGWLFFRFDFKIKLRVMPIAHGNWIWHNLTTILDFLKVYSYRTTPIQRKGRCLKPHSKWNIEMSASMLLKLAHPFRFSEKIIIKTEAAIPKPKTNQRYELIGAANRMRCDNVFHLSETLRDSSTRMLVYMCCVRTPRHKSPACVNSVSSSPLDLQVMDIFIAFIFHCHFL